MKVCLQVIAFNVDTWINQMLENAAPHVDKIFIAYPPRPWKYSQSARDKLKNPTKLSSIKIKHLKCEVEIIKGDWEYDEDTRNFLLERARSEEFDWMIIQDADEFYTEDGWKILKKEMNRNDDTELLITPWINFWKNPRFVLLNSTLGIKSLNEGAAIRAKKAKSIFTFSRTSNAIRRKVINADCYHYGYVMDNEAMRTKIQTWAHAKQIRDIEIWYSLKWLNWTEESRFLHPSSPYAWSCATPFQLQQPSFAYSFMKYNSQPIVNKKGVLLTLNEFIWDRRANIIHLIRKAKQILRNSNLNLRRNHTHSI